MQASARRTLTVIIAVVCSFLLAWAVFAEVTPPLSALWTFSMGPDPGNNTPATVMGDRVYVTRDGVAYCLDAMTGAQQWKFQPLPAGQEAATPETSGGTAAPVINTIAVTTAPVLAGELIAVGANNNTLYALSRTTGAVVWKVTASAPITPSPLLMDNLLIFGAGEMVYAVQPEDGKVAWLCSAKERTAYGPVTDGTMAYFLGADGSVQCVDATEGRYRWGVKLVTGPEVFPPIISSRRVIVATGRNVYAIARSGGISWTAEMPAGVGAAPSLVEDKLYVPCVDGRIYVLSGRSGAADRGVVYKTEYALTSSPVVTDTTIFVGTAEGLLLGLDRGTGAVKWEYRCRPPEQLPEEGAYWGVYGPMQVIEDTLFVLTGSGDLYRFSAAAPDGQGPVFASFLPKQGDAISPAEYGGVSFVIIDDATGVDPTSIKAELDGNPVAVSFDPITGEAMLAYKALADGSHRVRVTAKDYRGNESASEWSFVTDVKIIPEAATGTTGMRGTQTQPGMGGRGGAGGGRGGAGGGRGGAGGGRGGMGGGRGGMGGGRGGMGGGGGGMGGGYE